MTRPEPELGLVVASRAAVADGIITLDLRDPAGATLPGWSPGAHIDLLLGRGLTRQFSLCGDPADRARWRIAVLREPSGRGGSAYVHDAIVEGSLVRARGPRNHFRLEPADRYLFIAGGIGITPLIPMMRQARLRNTPWTLLYCNRRTEDAPFLAEIKTLGGEISLHSSEAGTRLDVAQRLATVQRNTQVYCCGPERLMTAVEQATTAWPEDSIHFEWFTPRGRLADETRGSFEVVCQRSGVTLTVSPDQSILAALTQAGVEIPRSCQQGVCGTCEVRLISGEVDHRDSILSSAEQAANRTMLVCVSRARGTRLVLDI
jgi:ferredoxin-NADP reductase